MFNQGNLSLSDNSAGQNSKRSPIYNVLRCKLYEIKQLVERITEMYPSLMIHDFLHKFEQDHPDKY